MTETTTWAEAPRMAATIIGKEYEDESGSLELGDRTVDSPLFWWVEVQLTGNDGNAFAIIGNIAECLKRVGLRAEAEAFAEDMMDSPSYDALLQHAMKTVSVS